MIKRDIQWLKEEEKVLEDLEHQLLSQQGLVLLNFFSTT